ncbi:MAG: zf-HC2 domain-containing protein [Thermoanaerobaculia bacterium]
MNDDITDLDRLFARLSDESRGQDLDGHPAPEKLSAYQANELSPEEDAVIQEHLAHCTVCTELLLDLQRFLEPPSEDLPREGVVDFETVAGWRELRGRMGGPESAEKEGSSWWTLGSRKRPYLLAAMFVLALGLSIGTYYSRSQLPNAQGVIPVSLESEVGERGGPEPPKVVALPEEEKLVSFLLTVNLAPRPTPPYFVTVRREQSPRVILSRTIDYYPEGFGLVIRSGLLTPGVYEISIEGRKTVPAEKIGLYHVKIRRLLAKRKAN